MTDPFKNVRERLEQGGSLSYAESIALLAKNERLREALVELHAVHCGCSHPGSIDTCESDLYAPLAATETEDLAAGETQTLDEVVAELDASEKDTRHPCPKGDGCALNDGAVTCRHCGRNWPPDETWDS